MESGNGLYEIFWFSWGLAITFLNVYKYTYNFLNLFNIPNPPIHTSESSKNWFLNWKIKFRAI